MRKQSRPYRKVRAALSRDPGRCRDDNGRSGSAFIQHRKPVADGFVGFDDDDEGVFILLAEDALEGHDLAAADDAQQGGAFCAGVGTAGRELGYTAVHLPHDPLRNLLPAGRHDKAGFVGGKTDDHHIHHLGGEEDINQRVKGFCGADQESGGDHYGKVNSEEERPDGNELEALVA